MNKTTIAILSVTDLLLPLPVFSLFQAGVLLIDVWQNLPRMRARFIEPPQLAMQDPEAIWWEIVADKLQQERMS